MKKFLLLLIFCLSYSTAFSQLDREHYFAPMVDRVGNFTNYQSIYMSTDETTPFKVEIYHNNVVIGSVNISKNNPAKYTIPSSQRNRIITSSQSDLFKPVAMGFYLKGEKPFFSSLRFSVNNHGEIQTSKGGAALGTEFRAVMAPITVNNGILNFMNSIMATENNTTVTVSEFSPTVRFSDGITRSSITFTLNRGQSYIIDGLGNQSQNYTGYIGAKIVSNKPIVIANGNFNGQYAGSYSTSSDTLMDQGVPVDKLGTEFVLMKGNGNVSNGMEKALVLATENGTQVFLNNNPIAVTTLNAGQYYQTPNGAYINQGSGHYNMYIRTSKNAYVYQLLAGDPGSSEVATGGMNYIPPLSCYLPKKIDEIGKIDENEYTSNNVPYSLTVPTKLNIITENGATVTVQRNGVNLALNSSNGPFNVSGNSNWVTYSIPNITGNIAVLSSHAVTAGISAGNDAVGYGGYFAGFSYTPAIIKSDGECLSDGPVKLEVIAGFNSYQWVIKNSGGGYDPAPGVNNLYYYTPTQSGIYAVIVQQGSCPAIQTADFKFFNCTTYTSTVPESICTTTTITPVFQLSSQSLSPATVKIDTPPTKGTATVNAATGVITYTANANATGTDTFKYSFCGIGAIPDCESVLATINLNQIEKYDVILRECSINGTATYDLTSAAVTPMTGITKTYWLDAAATAQPIPSAQWTNYSSTDRIVYVKMQNTFGCDAIAKIELKAKLQADVKPNLYTATHCDEDIDGILDGNYKVNLATITPIVLSNAASFTIKYYDTSTKATAGGTDNITGVYTFTATTNSIWIRAESPDGCPADIKEIVLNIGNKLTLITPTAAIPVCDVGGDGTETINLSTYTSLFYTGATTNVRFYNTLADAQTNPTNNITNPNVAVTGNRTFYYRISAAGLCDNIGELTINFGQGTPSTLLQASYTVCEGNTQVLDPGTGYSSYTWSTGATSQTITVGNGSYWVDLKNADGCIYRQNVNVVESPKAIVNTAAFNGMLCDTNLDGTIEVNFNTQVTPLVVTNLAAGPFTVSYYLNLSDPPLPNNWSYSTPTTVTIQVTSPHCPPVTQTINFGFGNSVPLITKTTTVTVCDTNLNGTEAVNLASYLPLFSTNSGLTVRYFNSITDANNNTGNITANQTINSDRTFYYRISQTGFCTDVATLNILFRTPTPSTLLQASYTVCDGSTQVLDPGAGYSSYTWSNGATSQTISALAGNYWVDLTNADGCTYRQNVSVVNSPKAIVNTAAFNGMLCDTNLDGTIEVNLSSQVTPIVFTNPTAAAFVVKYYATPGDAAAETNELPNNWTYSAPTTIYIRINSPYCPPVTQPINFGFASEVSLITKISTHNVCDANLNGSEPVNLSNYISFFTADTSATARYFNTYANAQSNTGNINTIQTINADRTFYYRISAASGCDTIGTLNLLFKKPTPSTTLQPTYIVCDDNTATVVLDAGPGYTSYAWNNGATSQTITVKKGNYWVNLTNADGCVYRQNVQVTGYPVANPRMTLFNGSRCDENFDGNYEVDFAAEVTNVLLVNPTLYTITYYSDSSLAPTYQLPNNWSYSVATKVYMKIESPYCPQKVQELNFILGNKVSLLTPNHATSVCDTDLDGIKDVDLSVYKSIFTNDNAVVVTYFETLANAQNNISPLSNPVNFSGTKTFYLRLSKSGVCSSIAELTVTVKAPKESTVLEDQKICPGTQTLIDAGAGFQYYKWMDDAGTVIAEGAAVSSITAGVGKYKVELTFDGCPYIQEVEITEVELPTIKTVEIVGTTVTVTATGGNPPYKYSLDGIAYQDSNVFTNVPYGLNTIYVISADNCAPATLEFTVIRLLNVITPNGDGYNDKLDYSDLAYKNDVLLKVYDRNGALIFTGDKSNKFTWDGKMSGKPVPSTSYWYILQWSDPSSGLVTQHKGWVLVKNRE